MSSHQWLTNWMCGGGFPRNDSMMELNQDWKEQSHDYQTINELMTCVNLQLSRIFLERSNVCTTQIKHPFPSKVNISVQNKAGDP